MLSHQEIRLEDLLKENYICCSSVMLRSQLAKESPHTEQNTTRNASRHSPDIPDTPASGPGLLSVCWRSGLSVPTDNWSSTDSARHPGLRSAITPANIRSPHGQIFAVPPTVWWMRKERTSKIACYPIKRFGWKQFKITHGLL